MTTTSVQTVTLSESVVDGIAWVGKIVTHESGEQYAVHSVEGATFYAHLADVQTITVDASMTVVTWLDDRDPVLTLIPMGHRMGEGFAREVYAHTVRRGVSLAKPWV